MAEPLRIPSTPREVLHIGSVITDGFDALQQRYEKSGVDRLQTGFNEFDVLTCGLHEGDFVVIGGRPSSGKSTFALNICQTLAIKYKKPVAIFTMETDAKRLGERMLATMARTELHRIRSGSLDDDDWPRISASLKYLRDAPIYIDDTPALSPKALYAKAKRLKADYGIALLVVDYIQLMQVPGTPENPAAEISEITRSLKALAKELRLVVLAISQLNRLPEHRPDKKPALTDLRSCGAIEDDADMVIFLYPDYYRQLASHAVPMAA